jgi:hypothetical protein
LTFALGWFESASCSCVPLSELGSAGADRNSVVGGLKFGLVISKEGISTVEWTVVPICGFVKGVDEVKEDILTRWRDHDTDDNKASDGGLNIWSREEDDERIADSDSCCSSRSAGFYIEKAISLQQNNSHISQLC